MNPRLRRDRPEVAGSRENGKEVGPSFRISNPKYPTKDPNYRIIAPQKSRYTHIYFYIRDEVVGPMVMCVGTFLPFSDQLLAERPQLHRARAPARGQTIRRGRQLESSAGGVGLRRAIAQGDLSLAYQPQVRLRDGALLGMEALLRWDCDGELRPAAAFIRAVEESAVIIDVGEWVIDEACRQLRAWRDAGRAPSRVALNIGARHFQHPGFLATIQRDRAPRHRAADAGDRDHRDHGHAQKRCRVAADRRAARARHRDHHRRLRHRVFIAGVSQALRSRE